VDKLSYDLYLFDIGNVTVRHIDSIEPMLSHYRNIPHDEFLRDLELYSHPILDGELSTEEYWRHVERRFNVEIEGEPFYRFFSPERDERTIALIRKLRRMGKRVVAASNNIEPHTRKLLEMGIDTVFDKMYLSQEMHLSKPYHEFFLYILEKEKTEASHALFIDDVAAFRMSAEEVGIDALEYVSGVKEDAFLEFGALC